MEKLSVNSLRHILHNDRYLGIYRYADVVIPDGMPQLIDQETFDKVQRRFEQNKRTASQRARGLDDSKAPRYWLAGKLYCGECKTTMHGVSGTGKHGEKHYYYACKNHRRHKCPKRNVRKDVIERQVLSILRHILSNDENRASLAVDASKYYREHYVDTHYLDGLKEELASTTKAIDNLVRAIEQGLPFTDSVSTSLSENEERKKALAEAIEAEEARSRVAKDETSIRAFFEKYANADFEDPATRDTLLEYFVDRIYLYDDGHFVITGWYWGDECHKLPEVEVEGLQPRSSAFEYVVDLPPGFDYFADGGTIANELPATGSFFVWHDHVGFKHLSTHALAYHVQFNRHVSPVQGITRTVVTVHI